MLPHKDPLPLRHVGEPCVQHTWMKPTEIVRGEICRQESSSCKEPLCSVYSFILGTEKEPLGGGECVIYALQDHSGRAVGIHIPRPWESSTYLLQNEIKIRKAIRIHQINRFQKLLGFGPTQESIVRVPFVLLEWAHGRPLVGQIPFLPIYSTEKGSFLRLPTRPWTFSEYKDQVSNVILVFL